MQQRYAVGWFNDRADARQGRNDDCNIDSLGRSKPTLHEHLKAKLKVLLGAAVYDRLLIGFRVVSVMKVSCSFWSIRKSGCHYREGARLDADQGHRTILMTDRN